MNVEAVPQGAALILAFGGAVTDALKGKIYNRWLLFGLFAGVLWLALVPVLVAFGVNVEYAKYEELGMWERPKAPSPRPWQEEEGSVGEKGGELPFSQEHSEDSGEPSFIVYGLRVVANSTLALIVGFLLWWFGLWAAGDAKMFACLSLLLPLGTYEASFFPLFPSYVLLFNTFASVMAILALELLARITRQALRPRQEEVEVFREAVKWVFGHIRDLILGFFGVLAFFFSIKTLRMLFRDVLVLWTALEARPLVYLILFLVFHPLVKAMRHKVVMVIVFTFAFGYIVFVTVHPTEHHNIKGVLQMGTVAASVMVFYLVYSVYLNVFDYRPVKIWQLRPGMILARKTIEKLKEDKDLLDHKLGEIGPDGLLPEQVEVLRRWWIDKGKGGVIWVSRTFPFAPALFFGTLVTILKGGYLIWT